MTRRCSGPCHWEALQQDEEGEAEGHPGPQLLRPVGKNRPASSCLLLPPGCPHSSVHVASDGSVGHTSSYLLELWPPPPEGTGQVGLRLLQLQKWKGQWRPLTPPDPGRDPVQVNSGCPGPPHSRDFLSFRDSCSQDPACSQPHTLEGATQYKVRQKGARSQEASCLSASLATFPGSHRTREFFCPLA